jgi:Flp pilus assembly pilin Flp
MPNAIGRLIDDDRGVTAIEYTLIAALIAVAAVLFILQIGADVSAPFNTIVGSL